MKLLYCGHPECDYRTLKRLALIGEELHFMDRPSVTFERWGTIGRDSEYRRIIDAHEPPVPLIVHAPPSGRAEQLHAPFIQADLSNQTFLETAFAGLRARGPFAARRVQSGARYKQPGGGEKTGAEILDAIVADGSILPTIADAPIVPGRLYSIEDEAGRLATLKVLMINLSIELTSAMLVAEHAGLLPITDEPEMQALLGLRFRDRRYVGNVSASAPWLGLVMARSVIPDEVVDRLEFPAVLDYRSSVEPSYRRWRDEINALAAKLDDVAPEDVATRAPQIIASEIVPRINEYELEMANARDKMFGDMVKSVASWKFPAVSLAWSAGINLPAALAAFAGMVVLPSVVDYYVARRGLGRKHGVAYLVGGLGPIP
jgi:hypothetical protein